MLAWLHAIFPQKTATAQQKSGNRGEQVAAAYLREKKGHRVLARNWRSPVDRRDELDLVTCDGEVLVFVEVKTRAAGALVTGYYAVNRRKKRVLLRACGAYLSALGRGDRPKTFRFDIVEVSTGPAGATTINHFENIPLFPKEW